MLLLVLNHGQNRPGSRRHGLQETLGPRLSAILRDANIITRPEVRGTAGLYRTAADPQVLPLDSLGHVLGRRVGDLVAEHGDRGCRGHHRGRRGGRARSIRPHQSAPRRRQEAASLPFSRSQESEADHIGLVYMARAEPPEFASDHPSDKHRVERIKEWLPEAERAYEAAR